MPSAPQKKKPQKLQDQHNRNKRYNISGNEYSTQLTTEKGTQTPTMGAVPTMGIEPKQTKTQ